MISNARPGLFSRLLIPGAVLITVPGILTKTGFLHNGHGLDALMFGIGLLGAAFMMSWAAEVIQIDISQGFALAILALVAVLPEYAVDMVLSWKAGLEFASGVVGDVHHGELALANMTGANRLLIGIGWPMVLILFFAFSKKKRLALAKEHGTEVFYLTLATLYAFTIPIKGYLNLLDTVILLAIFVLYVIRIARAEVHEPDLVGPAALIAELKATQRRASAIILFLAAGVVIFMSAEPFAEALVAFGKEAGYDEFLLLQWLAPLASEAPEIMIAAIWAVRGQAQAAMGALISSKVNQWTLLVGTIPVVFSMAAGRIAGLELTIRQDHEIWLTAGQSIFAVAILCNLRMSWYGAITLIVLFMAQFIFSELRMEVMYIYLILAVLLFIRDRKKIPGLFKTALKFK